MADETEPPYAIGYRRPPQESQFKAGQSGNPKGRPKGAKNLATIVGNAIREKVSVTENGKRKKVSKLEVIIMQMVNKAVTGDQKARLQLLPLVQMIEGREEAAAVSAPAASEADRLVMQSIIERIRRGDQQEAAPKKEEATQPLTIEKETDHGTG